MKIEMIKELFIKYLQGNCSEEEFEQFLSWLKQESLTASSERLIKEVWDDFDPAVDSLERVKYNRLLDRIHHQIRINENSTGLTTKKASSGNRFLSIITRAAAILLLPVLSLLLFTTFSEKRQFSENINDLEVEAPACSNLNFELGDGTKVWLNHGSKLIYPYRFDRKSRKVFLKGEAYFAVAHDKKVPFIVGTERLEIKATGTAFNVSAYPTDKNVETTLVEGMVVILESKTNREIKTMVPNQCLKFDIVKNTYTIESGNIEKYTAWKNGLLVFKNDPIEDVANRISRWYNIDVEITDKRAKEFTITATFSDESLSQVLELMTMPTPVSYKLTPKVKLSDSSYTKEKVTIGLK
jgi:transmembrane sensor